MKLNKKQKRAVQNTEDNLLVIAGPGSGKTLTLTKRFDKIVERGADPEDIVLTTFGKKAAEEIKDRISVNEDEHSLNIGTIHALCRQIVRKEYEDTNYSSKPRVKSGYSRIKFAEDLMDDYIDEEYPTKKSGRSQLKQDLTDVALKNIDRQRRFGNEPEDSEGSVEFLTPDDKRDISEFKKVKKIVENHLPDIYSDYMDEIYEENVLDFTQMIYETNQIFSNNESTRKRYASRYEYIMVDEAQDLNPMQWQVIDHLAGGEKLCLVGDDAQTIYSWRGSDPTLLHRFKEQYDAQKIVYSKNYRSAQNIVDVVNKLNDGLEDATPKMMVSGRGQVKEAENTPVVKQMSAEEVGERVIQLVEEGYSPEDIGIIARTNRLLYDYQKAIEQMTIPTYNLGQNSFRELWDVNKAYSYLRGSYKKDGRAMESILRDRNVYGIPSIKEAAEEEGKDLWQFVEDLPTKNDHIWKKKMRKVNRSMEFVDSLDEENPFQHLAETKFKKKGLTGNVKALHRLYKTLGEKEFFEYMEMDRMENGVDMATVHQAKGKEWKVVFVVSVNDGTFPIEDHPEEKRNFYVACSRAEDKLFVTYDDEPSEFVNWVMG